MLYKSIVAHSTAERLECRLDRSIDVIVMMCQSCVNHEKWYVSSSSSFRYFSICTIIITQLWTNMDSMDNEMKLAFLVGWGYTLCWCFSYVPQALLNYRRKSVKGFSLDFALFNLCGTLQWWSRGNQLTAGQYAYFVYNVSLMYAPYARDAYFKAHPGMLTSC